MAGEALKLYNTLSRKKELFEPIDPLNVRMYVCGPTVYDYAHIGNARPIIVFDVLYRLLRHIYGPEHVTYARNITDVEDKINDRAAEEGVAIDEITARTIDQFHTDIKALGVLEPTVEPRATDHIAQMKAMIEALVENGHAYVAAEHVLFDVASMPDYGRLSNRSLDEMEAGARVEVAPYKKGPMDFVLWKPSEKGEPAWPSPLGLTTPGRPGWHIECSAMSETHLGKIFDIHGGGIDLAFPHHENEIAQSRCAFETERMANVWMHNGFLQVEGQKMSKSLGNFVTINELLTTDNFGGRPWPGEVLRLAMLATHYRQPIDWTIRGLEQSMGMLSGLFPFADKWSESDEAKAEPVLEALADDLNTPRALSEVHKLDKAEEHQAVGFAMRFLGFTGDSLKSEEAKADEKRRRVQVRADSLITARNAARKAKNFAEADRIRDELAEMGIALKDGPDGTTWEVVR